MIIFLIKVKDGTFKIATTRKPASNKIRILCNEPFESITLWSSYYS